MSSLDNPAPTGPCDVEIEPDKIESSATNSNSKLKLCDMEDRTVPGVVNDDYAQEETDAIDTNSVGAVPGVCAVINNDYAQEEINSIDTNSVGAVFDKNVCIDETSNCIERLGDNTPNNVDSEEATNDANSEERTFVTSNAHTQEETNSINGSTDEEEDDINSFAHDDNIIANNHEDTRQELVDGPLPESYPEVTHIVKENNLPSDPSDENEFSNYEEEEKLSSLFENEAVNNCVPSTDNNEGISTLQEDSMEEAVQHNEERNSSSTTLDCADDSTNYEGEISRHESNDGSLLQRSGDFSGFSDDKKDASYSNGESQGNASVNDSSNFGDEVKKSEENGFHEMNCVDKALDNEEGVSEERVFKDFGQQGSNSVEKNIEPQFALSGIPNDPDEETTSINASELNQESQMSQRENSASELHQQSSQDVTSSVPDAEKEDSLNHWSDGDSSPGRLQIDAEDLPEPVKSDDDADPSALTIDMGEEEPPEVENKPLEDSEPVEEPTSTVVTCTNLEQTIDNVAKGNMSPIKLELKMKIPLKRKRQLRKFKRTPTGTKMVHNNGKPVQKWHVSSMLKCPRCPMSSFNTVSALLEHQRGCGSNTVAATPAASGDLPKMPRKVYMCSACGSYFENWNLFVHMKEMHKRHMCLYCLGMFSQAGKLAQHLATKHQVWDQTYVSGDQLSAQYPGPHFMLCCRCDRMCTDKDFESHSCSSVCSHCGLSGTHYPTCRLAPQAPPKASRAPRRRSRVPKKVKEPPKEVPPTPPATVEQPAFVPDLRSPAEELSPTTFNERMLQLYRANKPAEKNISSMESIEETINRVIEESAVGAAEEETSVDDTAQREPEPEERKEPTPEPMDTLEEEKEEEIHVPPVEEPPTEADESTMNHSDEDTSDSEKLTIALDPGGVRRNYERPEEQEGAMLFAGEEIPFSSVPLSEPLNVARVPIAMKLFVRSTSLTCVYCAHARKIAVNGKQLALHLMAQHRYITVAESASITERDSSHAVVVRCLREALPTLETVYFNAYGYDSNDKSAWRSADRVYECFHCCYSTPDSKEFLSHNRKIHQNASHLCIMCKTRFLTYSELLCHLCSGVYIPGRIIDPLLHYRCYSCDCEPLPSSFQLMVHLRTMHTACDMCFALCESQSSLYAHVQKHKFLFYCYACALTYRTRQEMTKHIFWKHGAESVTCKRCLQKKWKHAYHFCLPPAGFPCDECAGWFKSSSAVRVHKRLHQNDYPHACSQCDEKFISRKLLAKHAIKHEPVPPPVNGSMASSPPVERKKKLKKKKEVNDLFDLPPVNLSESDDSSEDDRPKEKTAAETEPVKEATAGLSPSTAPGKEEAPPVGDAAATSVDSSTDGKMWDGVLAGLEGNKSKSYPIDSPFYNLPVHRISAIMLADHDYCRPVTTVADSNRAAADHDYCNNGMMNANISDKRPAHKTSKKRTRSSSSDSSSSSSGSCTCGSNCSCSSSSSSTESASSGEPRPARVKTKESKAAKKKSEADKIRKAENEVEPCIDVVHQDIQESDLETDEPITDDDDFYEKNPALRASEVLQKNRSLLLDKLETSQTNYPRPSKEHRSKPKSKKSRPSPSYYADSPNSQIRRSTETADDEYEDGPDTPGGRRPRRKRVPLKYYGFSSGEEDDFPPMHIAPSRKKERPVEHNTTIPAPPQPPVEESPEPSNLWNPPSWRPPPVPPKVNPIKIRTGSLKQTFAKSVDSGEFKITRADLGGFQVNGGATESRSGEKLYCFCQCPYDEVSEMIACDAVDCRIEWFHFECVGIMVPPKGKWFCPECKKKAAAESEMMGLPLRPV